MAPDQLHNRITDQFSYRGKQTDIWRAFDLLLDTDEFLNLGYSKWYQPHVLGSSQRRLATRVGTTLTAHLTTTEGIRLLDIGCGRGGPALHLANRFGFSVTGLDLVPYNITQATENAREQNATAKFVAGDATQLPFKPESFAACTAIDSLVYLPDREAGLEAITDVLDPEGVVVLSDLVMRPDVGEQARQRVSSFADLWDMPPLGTVEGYKQAIDDTTLCFTEFEDITYHSVGRFRKWTTLFLWMAASPMGVFINRFLRSYGLDPSMITDQVECAHHALPYLRHIIFVAQKEN